MDNLVSHIAGIDVAATEDVSMQTEPVKTVHQACFWHVRHSSIER